MEELFFWDDRPAYPCACFFRAAFHGELDRLALERAIQRTLARYPLLCSKVDSTGRPRWLPPDFSRFLICWDLTAAGEALPKAGRIDLSAESGGRFYAASGGGRSALTIQFHHSCSDGLGIMRFLRDVLAAYADPCAPAPSSLQEASHEPRRRSRWWPPSRMPGALWRAWLIARRRPLPLIPGKPPHPESPLHEDYPSALWHTLDPKETALLLRAASRQKVTLNDLLLRDLLLALADAGCFDGRDGWVRILVPELTEKARALPGSTSDPVSTLFLDVHTGELASPGLLLKIHRDMMAKKLAGDGDLLRHGADLGRRLRGGLAKHVRANKCLFTTIFSNLGKVPMEVLQPSGNGRFAREKLRLESVQAVQVVRLYSPVNFMVLTVAGSLSLTMSFDGRVLSRDKAEVLFNGLLGKLRDSAQAAG